MLGVKMKPSRRRGRRAAWMRLALPLKMILVALVVTLAMVTGLARAEFHQPYYQNGFGFDSQLPLMPNNPLEEQILSAATGGRGSNADSGLIHSANAAWAAGGEGAQSGGTSVNYSTYLQRKEVLMPLIADLIRFHNLNTEVYEAYVLNVDQQHHSQLDRNGTRNDTAGGGVVVTSVVIDTGAGFPYNAGATGGSAASSTASGGSSTSSQEHLEQLLLNDLSYLDLTAAASGDDALEGGMSVLEQNLADLNDFCDTNNSGEREESGGGGSSNSYYSFNNLSYNLIPKDLLEATDLFWSTTPLVIGGRQAVGRDSDLKTRENDGDDDPEDKKYLEYINKAGDGEKEEGDEKTDQADCLASVVKTELVEDEERLELAKEEPIETEAKEETETVGSTVAEEAKESEVETESVFKLEHLEDSDLIEELPEELEAEQDAKTEVAEEDAGEEKKPVIFNILDSVDEEEEGEARDWFLNGNEVISASRRSRSSTFDDIPIEEFSDEDSDLVNVLWKQDVDLGFSLILPDAAATTNTAKAAAVVSEKEKEAAAAAAGKVAALKKAFCSGGASDDTEDDIQKLNALLEIKSDERPSGSTKDDYEDGDLPNLGNNVCEPWNFDAETGEIIQNLQLQLDDTLIADSRQELAELAEKEKEEDLANEALIQSLDQLLFSNSTESDVSQLDQDQDPELGAVGLTEAKCLDESSDEVDFYANELKEFLDDMMIQTNMPFQHPRSVMPNYGPHSANNLFQSPYYPHPHHHAHHHHPHYAPNFSSAVSSSIHLTNSSSDSENGTASTYKMEHDLALYSNTSSEMNMTSDGFLNSILNDEDLHLMDIGAHEGMYPMRMLDSNATNNSTASSMMSGPVAPNMLGLGSASLPVGGASGIMGDMGAHGDRLEASSDSAVSSMASEPMSSLSDGEWGDTGSDSAQEYSQKYGVHHHLNGAGAGAYGGGAAGGSARQSTSIAQKKHHMFGKRYFQEQNSSATNGGPKAGLSQHHPHNLVPGSIKYDYDAYGNYHHGHPNAALHQNGHHLSIGAAVPQLPPPPPPPPSGHSHHHHHHQLTVDNMKTYQADLNRVNEMKYSGTPDFAYQQQQQQAQQQPQHWHSPQPTPRMINEFLHHNHTYPMPPQNSGAVPKPQARDKKRATGGGASKAMEAEEQMSQHNRSMAEHITRDEKRAKALGVSIPIPVPDIINLPMDEFNERLSKYELSETQLSLIRDIRRRGKNKVAAQNCRKRKLDQIMSLADEVKVVKKQKDELMAERNAELLKQKKIKERFTALHRHVFQYLRDPDGNLYSANQYSLQQSADGSVYLLPRDRKSNGGPGSSQMNDYGRSQNHTQDG